MYNPNAALRATEALVAQAQISREAVPVFEAAERTDWPSIERSSRSAVPTCSLPPGLPAWAHFFSLIATAVANALHTSRTVTRHGGRRTPPGPNAHSQALS